MNSNLFQQQHMEYIDMGTNGGYSHFNYATLNGTGMARMLDFMRYERAFFVRDTDLNLMVDAARDYGEWITRRFAILFGKYDSHGKTKPDWTQGRLTSDQELEIHNDPITLYQLGGTDVPLRPTKRLRWQHILEVEGPLSWVLEVMFMNKAMPSTEADSGELERAMFQAGQTCKVKLTNFCISKTMWTLPTLPPGLV